MCKFFEKKIERQRGSAGKKKMGPLDMERGVGRKMMMSENAAKSPKQHSSGFLSYYVGAAGSSSSSCRIPWLIPLIALAEVGLFIAAMRINYKEKRPYNEDKLFGPSSETLEAMGALLSDKITEKHQLWRLCAGFWLHRSVVHLIVSTLSVLFVGIRFEQEFGFLRIGIIYVLSGFGGSLFYALNVSSYVMAGATAPLFGLIGAMLSELFINWTLCTNKRAHFSTALVIAIINFLLLGKIGFEYGGMALIFGGLSTGLILGFVLLVRPQIGSIEGGGQHLLLAKASDKDKYQGYQYLLWVVALIAFIAGFVQTFVKLFKLMHSNTVGANA